MFTGDLCGVPSQFFRHISSAFVDLLGYFTQAFSRIYPCFDFYSIRQCHSTHVSLLSAGCDRNYYTAYCRGERHPITTFLPLKCYLHFCNQPLSEIIVALLLSYISDFCIYIFIQLCEADKHILFLWKKLKTGNKKAGGLPIMVPLARVLQLPCEEGRSAPRVEQ